jgi:hypothetical protein
MYSLLEGSTSVTLNNLWNGNYWYKHSELQ